MNRKPRVILTCLLLFVLALTGQSACAQSTPSMLVSTDWLAAHLKDANLVVLDIGNDRDAYLAGHIPGAQFLSLRQIVNMNAGGWMDLPPDSYLKSLFEQAGVGDHSRIVLYGDYKGMFAARAYFTLDWMGLGNRAALLDGGLEKWVAEHRPLGSDLAFPHPATLTVAPHPAVVTDLPAVMRVVASHSTPLIDARGPAEFAGAQGGFGAVRPGHIPGARNVFWVENLASTAIPVLKPIPSLRALYEAAGVKPGAKAIVYCHAGLQSSYDYFALRLAGFHPVLYAGSYSQWVSAPGTQVAAAGE